jgi:crotonobetainyl-CoA:carnitine CoA-transferase CaiB-like acyl-CoA transferase
MVTNTGDGAEESGWAGPLDGFQVIHLTRVPAARLTESVGDFGAEVPKIERGSLRQPHRRLQAGTPPRSCATVSVTMRRKSRHYAAMG